MRNDYSTEGRANHVGECIRRYSLRDLRHRRGPSPERIVAKSPGTDRRDPMVGANHVGECIRRYSSLGLRDTAIKKTLTHGCG